MLPANTYAFKHHTYSFDFGFLPGFFGFGGRSNRASSRSINDGVQGSRPVRSCFRMSLTSSSGTGERKKSGHFFFINSSIGSTVTSR